MPTDVYDEHVRADPEVCNNCFRQIRVERVDPGRRTLAASEPCSYYSRHQRNTDIDYVRSENVKNSKQVFCDCGSDSHRHRVWDDSDDRCFRMTRVKQYIRHLTTTLDAKGIDYDTETFVKLSLQYYRDDHDLDHAFGEALETAIQVAVARSGGSRATAD
jgi:hypothetical protein